MKASDLKVLTGLLIPCLSPVEVLPILSKIVFTKGSVYAYNETVATIYQWDHGLGEFAVDGKALASLLQQWGDEPVEMKVAGTSLQFKCGVATAKLPVLGKESFIFEVPQMKGWVEAYIGDDTGQAKRLKETLEVVSPSSINPAYKAVTLANDPRVRSGASLVAYATNGSTIIHACVGRLKTVPSKPGQWIVPRLAIEQMLAAIGMAEKSTLKVKLGAEILWAEVSDVIVISKLISETAPNFHKPVSIEPYITIDDWKQERLHRALNIASAVQDSYKGFCQVRVEKGVLKLYSRGSAKGDGEATDEIKLAKVKGEGAFTVNPDLFRKAFDFDSLDTKAQLRVGEGAMIFGSSDPFLYAMALTRVKRDENEDDIPF